MKKILTVSLFAVMAVSAAHADIASTNYVGTQIQNFNTSTVEPLGDKVGSATFTNGVAAGKTDVTAAIDAVAGAVAGLSGEGGEVAGALTAAKEYTDTAAKADADGKLDSGFVKDYVDNQLTAMDNLVGEASTGITNLTTNLNNEISRAKAAEKVNADAIAAINNVETGTLAQAKTYADEKVAGLDVNKVTADDGKYFNVYAEEDGKISMEQKAFETTIVADVANAPTTDAVYEAIEAAKNAGKTDLENIDSEHAAVANEFVTGMTQVDGKITAVATSTINDAVVALGQVPDECGANGTNKCALSVSKGTFTWEIIEE